jgi:hypothetical protein
MDMDPCFRKLRVVKSLKLNPFPQSPWNVYSSNISGRIEIKVMDDACLMLTTDEYAS